MNTNTCVQLIGRVCRESGWMAEDCTARLDWNCTGFPLVALLLLLGRGRVEIQWIIFWSRARGSVKRVYCHHNLASGGCCGCCGGGGETIRTAPIRGGSSPPLPTSTPNTNANTNTKVYKTQMHIQGCHNKGEDPPQHSLHQDHTEVQNCFDVHSVNTENIAS